jgi:hypothetical protein
MEKENYQCPKCKAFSGDDWSCCNKSCPLQSSPHYNENLAKKYNIFEPKIS